MIELKIKKASPKEETMDQMPALPQLSQIMPTQPSPGSSSDQESRSRSESIRDKTKIINDQLNDVKYIFLLLKIKRFFFKINKNM